MEAESEWAFGIRVLRGIVCVPQCTAQEGIYDKRRWWQETEQDSGRRRRGLAEAYMLIRKTRRRGEDHDCCDMTVPGQSGKIIPGAPLLADW